MQIVWTSWNKKEKNIWKTSIEWNRNENMPQRASNSPWPIWSGALHADEIAFVFGQVRVFACICICVCVWPGQSVFASICICILNFATSIFASWCVAVLKMKYTYVHISSHSIVRRSTTKQRSDSRRRWWHIGRTLPKLGACFFIIIIIVVLVIMGIF